jgi:YrbI family 3-deoxy-D-manno-octulosonate 8-phosphate phosphatase
LPFRVPTASACGGSTKSACGTYFEQGVQDKVAVVRERAAALDVSLGQTAYVGNDINDAECLRAVGVSVAPADAWPEVKAIAQWVLSRSGGHGCVREFCDAVWAARRR